jgi:ABC-2 type transport system permease protein
MQTVFAPVVTALLYLLVFAQVMDTPLKGYEAISYGAFMIPGLVMMSVLQNAFSNTSSSIIQSKMYGGSLIFVLLAPISAFEFMLAFVVSAIIRGLMVGVGVWAVGWVFFDLTLQSPFFALAMLIAASGFMGAMGLIAGLWAEKYDHLAGFQNFIIMPLTFLSGVFYSVNSLPGFWADVSMLNPFFYAVDGFRYALFGVSDANPWLSLGMLSLFFVLMGWISLVLLARGYKIRN